MLDLFSGIGGFSLAASWTGGIKTVAFCEIEPFCQQVLRKHWPDALIHDDIRTLRGDDVGPVDIVCGGFPCQPFSYAGKRRGKADDRHLWPEMFRIIQETKPTWVVGENVVGLIELGLEQCFFDLESEGYEVQPLIIPASAVNAPHTRYRVWILAHTDSSRHIHREPKEQSAEGRQYAQRESIASSYDVAYPDSEGLQGNEEQGGHGCEWSESHDKQFVRCGRAMRNWEAEPDVGRVADGIPDRVHRLKALGNSIVPQVVYPIFQGIVDIEQGGVTNGTTDRT